MARQASEEKFIDIPALHRESYTFIPFRIFSQADKKTLLTPYPYS
jgi:hypothetical protein